MDDASPLADVLFVDQSGSLGGAELSLLDIASNRKRDHVALLGEGPFLDKLDAAGVTTHVFDAGLMQGRSSGLFAQVAAVPSVTRAAFWLARLAKRTRLLYANTQKAAVVGAVAAQIARRPMIWHLRDIISGDHFSSMNRRAVIALTNRTTHCVIANSRATADAYRDAGGTSRVEVVYNGIRRDPFDAVRHDDARAVLRELGIPNHHTVIGVFGRLASWKGQHVLLEALSRSGPADAHVLVVGAALFCDEDRDYEKALREQSLRPPLRGRVHFLGHRSDVPTLMRACDLITHTSTAPEPFGRVIVEGMLAGKPVIATAAGGAAEIIESGVTGLLAAPGSPSSLADSLRQLMVDDGLRSRLSQAGQAAARVRFDLGDRLAQVDEIIHETIAASPCSAERSHH